MMYKKCIKCNEMFEATTVFFYKQKNGEFGLHPYCKKCFSKHNKQYYEKNKKLRKKQIHDWYMKNKEMRNKYTSQWRKNNIGKCNSYCAKRQSHKLNQTPSNANMKLIKFYYMLAATMADYEIDHIKPLSKGGLHHEDNLQILSIQLNREKAAKWPLTPVQEIKYRGNSITKGDN